MSKNCGATKFCIRNLLAVFLVSGILPAWAASKKREEPTATSVFPIGVQRGTTDQIEIRGIGIEGTYEVVSDSAVFTTKVESVEDFELEPAWVPPDYRSQPRPKRIGQKVRLSVEVSHTASIGPHFFRLVTPQGLTNRLMLLVGSDRISVEMSSPHQTADQPQELQIPASLNGRITKDGEVDFYSFNASEGQEFAIEVNPQPPTMYEVFWGKPILDAQLILYELTGSWFSPNRVRAVAFNDEPISARIDTRPRLTYRFPKSGRYVVSVSSFMGRGHADYVYQLTVTPPAAATPTSDLARKLAIDTRFQAFVRKIEPDRIQRLLDRSVRIPEVEEVGRERSSFLEKESASGGLATKPAMNPTKVLPVVREARSEGNVSPASALEIAVPSLIEGSIESPTEVDLFRFKVGAGQRLAFEIETPAAAPPVFNPRLSVVDGQGQELFSNVYKRIGRERYVKDIEAKTLFTFARAGEYTLQIRNIIPEQPTETDNFRYRILVREQVPHVGAVELHESRPLNANSYWWKFGLVDRINLEIGKAKKLLVIGNLEEEFSGIIAVSVLDCPKSIQVLPGTELDANPLPPVDEGKKEQFVPKTSSGTLTLLANSDALVTRTPQTVQVVFRPIVDGVLGATLEVAELPLMVVAPSLSN